MKPKKLLGTLSETSRLFILGKLRSNPKNLFKGIVPRIAAEFVPRTLPSKQHRISTRLRMFSDRSEASRKQSPTDLFHAFRGLLQAISKQEASRKTRSITRENPAVQESQQPPNNIESWTVSQQHPFLKIGASRLARFRSKIRGEFRGWINSGLASGQLQSKENFGAVKSVLRSLEGRLEKIPDPDSKKVLARFAWMMSRGLIESPEKCSGIDSKNGLGNNPRIIEAGQMLG